MIPMPILDGIGTARSGREPFVSVPRSCGAACYLRYWLWNRKWSSMNVEMK